MSIDVGDTGGTIVVEDDVEIDIDLEEEGEGDPPPQDAAPRDKRGAEENAEDDGGDDETPAQRRERIKRTSREKRAHRREMATRDAEIIEALTEAVRVQGEQLQQISGTVQRISINDAVKSRDHWVGRARQLRAERAKAIENGEGEKAIVLEERFNQAVANANHFDAMLPDDEPRPQAQPQQRQPAADNDVEIKRTVEANARHFMSKHAWYDPSGADKDSALVKRLDREVAASGLHPATAAYWQELERRMDAQGLIAGDDGDDAPRQDQRQDQRQDPPRNERGQFTAQRPAGGPPVAGRSEGAASGKVSIPKALKDSMVEAGLWDNKESRNRIIKTYLAQQKAKK